MAVVPNDTLIGPIQDQLALVAQQIEGIDPALVFARPPKGVLKEGSVLFPCKGWAIEGMTNARIRFRLTFNILHLFRNSALDIAIPSMQAYIPAWWAVLGDWNNQTLGGTVKTLDLGDGQITTIEHNGTTYLAIVQPVKVLAEFNVNTTPR